MSMCEHLDVSILNTWIAVTSSRLNLECCLGVIACSDLLLVINNIHSNAIQQYFQARKHCMPMLDSHTQAEMG